jgi:hypothetical protein
MSHYFGSTTLAWKELETSIPAHHAPGKSKKNFFVYATKSHISIHRMASTNGPGGNNPNAWNRGENQAHHGTNTSTITIE